MIKALGQSIDDDDGVASASDAVPVGDDFKPPFPPKRAVEHEIEIIPGSSPPSTNYYKQSPDKDRETEQQLKELFNHG
eukprot:362173-Chlamydomonas_euryale.AAC.2